MLLFREYFKMTKRNRYSTYLHSRHSGGDYARPAGVALDDGAGNGSSSGMSARDYFAAATLTGLIAGRRHKEDDRMEEWSHHYVAEAYRYADLMLSRRCHGSEVDLMAPPWDKPDRNYT
jgi:hypothetical protein